MINSTATSPVKRTGAKKLKFFENFDLPLAVIVITLFAIGLLMVYSASWQYAVGRGDSEYKTVLRQLGIGIVSIVGAGLITFIDYRLYKKFVVWGMLGIVVLCLLVLLFGQATELGARRGLLSGSIQPSEFAKLGIIIYLSFWLYSKRNTLDRSL